MTVHTVIGFAKEAVLVGSQALVVRKDTSLVRYTSQQIIR